MLQMIRKLGTPNFLYVPRMSRITSGTHDVVFPSGQGSRTRACPGAHLSDVAVVKHIAFFALLKCHCCFTEGRLRLPCPEGECQ